MRRRDLSRRVTEHAHFGSVKWCIDGSTDRRCFAIVTNERALLSKLGQPVRKVIQTPYCVFRRVNKRLKTAPFVQLYGALSISATDTN